MEWWSLLLAPEEKGAPSKIGTFDETAILDTPALLGIAPRLRKMKKKAGKGKLWSFDYVKYNLLFKKVSEVAGVSVLKAHPYALRHGGASHDSLHRHRDMQQIKKQGRWKCDSSVARYNKHARVITEANKLHEKVRKYGNKVELHIVDWILHPAKAGAPPKMRLVQG